MNTSTTIILPIAVRNCRTLSIIQMFFDFIERRYYENNRSQHSIKYAEGYLAEIQHYVDTCTKYQHLHASVNIANRYLSVATSLVKQMKGE